MQRITGLWNSGRRGKLTILVGALISFCLCCSGLTALSPTSPAEPTLDAVALQTTSFETALSNLINTNSSSTSAPTLTLVPTFASVSLEEYSTTAASRFQALQAAFAELINVHNQFTADMSLAQKEDWYSHTLSAVTNVTLGADELASMQNFPSEYQGFHSEILLMSQAGKNLFSNYTVALEKQDVNALNNATANLTEMITRLNNASAAIAVAAITPTPKATNTSKPLPTATLIPFVPTSAPAAGVCSCAGDTLNCGDFGSHSSAQACFNFCVQQGRGDIHRLDGNNDGNACESL